MKIGLFGGTFNPPHLAHLVVADTVLDRLNLDQVWWIPTATPPHKQHKEGVVAPEHRLAMTERATASNDSFKVCNVEIQRQGVSYTVDTIRVLQEQYPKNSFWFVLGGDMLVDFPSWHRSDEIVERVPLVVYPRPNAELTQVPEKYRSYAQQVETPLMGISGTDIRQRIRNGYSCRYIVPDTVLAYIQQHKLYAK